MGLVTVNFTNTDTVHVVHSLGNVPVPNVVFAEGFERIVEVEYGNNYFDVLFGRVMASGTVTYDDGIGGGGGSVPEDVPGETGTPVKGSVS